MNRHTCVICIGAVLLSACASDPSDPESQAKLAATLSPVQSAQPGDNQMSCDDLSAQIKQIQWDISALTLQINSAQNTNTGFALLGALAGIAGATATSATQAATANVEGIAANTGGAISASVGMSKDAIRSTYQGRYDNLVGIFNGKNCSPST